MKLIICLLLLGLSALESYSQNLKIKTDSTLVEFMTNPPRYAYRSNKTGQYGPTFYKKESGFFVPGQPIDTGRKSFVYASPDSACYSLEENAKITRALLELKQLRADYPALAKSAGSNRAYRLSVDSLLAAHEAKRAFLGIGIRKQKRRLREAVNALP